MVHQIEIEARWSNTYEFIYAEDLYSVSVQRICAEYLCRASVQCICAGHANLIDMGSWSNGSFSVNIVTEWWSCVMQLLVLNLFKTW